MKTKKADMKYSFIVIVLILLIVIAFILVNSGAFGKGKQFVSSCISANPAFEYKCADKISEGATTCSYADGWSIDRSKDCGEGIECCFKER